MSTAPVAARVKRQLFACFSPNADCLVAEATHPGVLCAVVVGVGGLNFHNPAIFVALIAQSVALSGNIFDFTLSRDPLEGRGARQEVPSA